MFGGVWCWSLSVADRTHGRVTGQKAGEAREREEETAKRDEEHHVPNGEASPVFLCMSYTATPAESYLSRVESRLSIHRQH